MSGIVGAVAHRNVADIVFEGLRRSDTEHLGACSITLIDGEGRVSHARHHDGLGGLVDTFDRCSLRGKSALGHLNQREECDELAGVPTTAGHCEHSASVVVVGSIDVPLSLNLRLQCLGYSFQENCSAGVACALLSHYCRRHESLKTALDAMLVEVSGRFALIVLHEREPDTLYCVQRGESLVIGVGIGEHLVSSQPKALLQLTDRIVWLENFDTARVKPNSFQVWDGSGAEVDRDVVNLVPNFGRSNNSGSHSPCF